MTNKTKVCSIRLPLELVAKLKSKHINLSHLCKHLLQVYVAKEAPKKKKR